MMPLLAIIGSIVIIAIILWLLRGRPVFVIDFKGGAACMSHGQAPQAFLEDCEHIARDNQLDGGRVSGTRGPDGIRLVFSSGLSSIVQQRLRNAWQVSGR